MFLPSNILKISRNREWKLINFVTQHLHLNRLLVVHATDKQTLKTSHGLEG